MNNGSFLFEPRLTIDLIVGCNSERMLLVHAFVGPGDNKRPERDTRGIGWDM